MNQFGRRWTLALLRVQVDHDDHSKSFGIVRAITPRGYKIECDGGGTIYTDKWRLRIIDDESGGFVECPIPDLSQSEESIRVRETDRGWKWGGRDR